MASSHNIHRLSDISYLVSIVLDNEDALYMKSEFDSDLIKNSHVEGFRKGKAPLHVVINKYGWDKYYKDMREYIAQKAFDEVTEKSDRINPAVKPSFEFADWKEGGKFVFTATVVNQPADPADMFISPDTGLPEHASHTTFNKPIAGLPGQMPIIDGKLPPHLAGNVKTPARSDLEKGELSGASKIQRGDPTRPIHRDIKPPHEEIQTPPQQSETSDKSNTSDDEE